MTIIVISGKQGAGKSTLAKNIRNFYKERPVFNLRFAQPLYEMHDLCRSVLQKYNFAGYDYNIKDGNLLQLLGTEWGRTHVSERIWVTLLHNQLRTLPEDAIVTIEDCRFENEFDSFETVPGVIRIRLEAGRQTRMRRVEMWRNKEDHPSETSLDQYAAMGKFDMILHTDKTDETDALQQVVNKITLTQWEVKNGREQGTIAAATE